MPAKLQLSAGTVRPSVRPTVCLSVPCPWQKNGPQMHVMHALRSMLALNLTQTFRLRCAQRVRCDACVYDVLHAMRPLRQISRKKIIGTI